MVDNKNSNVSNLRSRRCKNRRNLLTGLAFISPWILGFVAFIIGPFLVSVSRSFTDWGMLSAPKWCGLENYVELVHDKIFWTAFGNTWFFIIWGTFLTLVCGLLIAWLLAQEIPGVKMFRTIFIMPYLTPIMAACVIFLLIYEPNLGMLNKLLALFGIAPKAWLKDQTTVKAALLAIMLWKQGNVILIFLAAIKGVPAYLYEAAEIEGAGSFKKFISITLPQISGVIVLNSITSIIGYFQVFVEPNVLTAGGPGKSSLTYNLYLYNKAFGSMRMGYATAMSTILFLIILVFTIVYLKLSKKFVYSEVD